MEEGRGRREQVEDAGKMEVEEEGREERRL